MDDKELVKIVDIHAIKRFFSCTDDKAKQLCFTKSSIYEASTAEQSRKTAYLIGYYGDTSQMTITESSAGIGANTAEFAKVFKNVNAVELDTNTMGCLMTNMKVLGNDNVNLVLGNYLERMTDLTQDVMFVDPPWLGVDYKKNQNPILAYKMNDRYVKMHDLAKIYHDADIPLIVFKLPNKTDMKLFESSGYEFMKICSFVDKKGRSIYKLVFLSNEMAKADFPDKITSARAKYKGIKYNII